MLSLLYALPTLLSLAHQRCCRSRRLHLKMHTPARQQRLCPLASLKISIMLTILPFSARIDMVPGKYSPYPLSLGSLASFLSHDLPDLVLIIC